MSEPTEAGKLEEAILLSKLSDSSNPAATKAFVLDAIATALRDIPTMSTEPKTPNKFMSREWLVALAVIAAGGLLIYKGEMDRGVELVKWTMVAFIGSRTAVKGLEVFKKNGA